jgi:predicted secreted protein
MRRWTVLFFAVVMMATPLACDIPKNCGDAETIELTLEDNGQVIRMDLDDEIMISLRTHRTEGYTWVNTLTEGSKILQVGEPQYDDSNCVPDGPTGCEGTVIFHFQANESVTGAIKLQCVTLWDPVAAPIETFEVTVIASPS